MLMVAVIIRYHSLLKLSRSHSSQPLINWQLTFFFFSTVLPPIFAFIFAWPALRWDRGGTGGKSRELLRFHQYAYKRTLFLELAAPVQLPPPIAAVSFG